MQRLSSLGRFGDVLICKVGYNVFLSGLRYLAISHEAVPLTH